MYNAYRITVVLTIN